MILKKFEGEVIGKKTKMNIEINLKNEKRAKFGFFQEFYLAEHHLFAEAEKYKEMHW